MDNTARWVGQNTITLGKPKWRFQVDKATVTLPFTGAVQDLMSQRPLVSSQIEGYADYGLLVTSVEIDEEDGGTGTMIVTLETTGVDPVTTAPLGEPSFEIDFGELTRPIEMHPRCGVLKADRPSADSNGSKRTWEDWANLTSADYDDSGENKWKLSDYQSLKAAGVDNYNVGSPVLRRTLRYFVPPPDIGADCYVQQDPPNGCPFAGVDSWNWLVGPDRCTREGRLYIRVTEWIGAQTISALIYKSLVGAS